jgi:hypothetical protein
VETCLKPKEKFRTKRQKVSSPSNMTIVNSQTNSVSSLTMASNQTQHNMEVNMNDNSESLEESISNKLLKVLQDKVDKKMEIMDQKFEKLSHDIQGTVSTTNNLTVPIANARNDMAEMEKKVNMKMTYVEDGLKGEMSSLRTDLKNQ